MLRTVCLASLLAFAAAATSDQAEPPAEASVGQARSSLSPNDDRSKCLLAVGEEFAACKASAAGLAFGGGASCCSAVYLSKSALQAAGRSTPVGRGAGYLAAGGCAAVAVYGYQYVGAMCTRYRAETEIIECGGPIDD